MATFKTLINTFDNAINNMQNKMEHHDLVVTDNKKTIAMQ